VHCLRFSPDGRSLVSGGEDSLINVWDLGLLDVKPRGVDKPK